MSSESIPRFFIPPEAEEPASFIEGGEVSLPQAEAHHAAHVLRLGPGNAVEIFDGRGGAATGRLVAVERGSAIVRVQSVRPPAPRPKPTLRLAFAVPKGKRLDWLLEKATELGAAALAPVRFARSVAGRKPLTPATRGRWLARCIAAAKQARVAHLPTLEPVRPLADVVTPSTPAIVGALTDEAVPLANALTAMARTGTPESVHIYVGPEGGLTEEEREVLWNAGTTAVRLGQTVLRTETAAVALLAATAVILNANAQDG